MMTENVQLKILDSFDRMLDLFAEDLGYEECDVEECEECEDEEIECDEPKAE